MSPPKITVIVASYNGERFVGDMAIRERWANIPHIEPNGFRVGIVGSGPAGMACAADMAKAGCEVVVYEAFHEAGGVLKYGIPDFRLPNTVVDAEIRKLGGRPIVVELNGKKVSEGLAGAAEGEGARDLGAPPAPRTFGARTPDVVPFQVKITSLVKSILLRSGSSP